MGGRLGNGLADARSGGAAVGAACPMRMASGTTAGWASAFEEPSGLAFEGAAG
jgi:hypothetical protein